MCTNRRPGGQVATRRRPRVARTGEALGSALEAVSATVEVRADREQPGAFDQFGREPVGGELRGRLDQRRVDAGRCTAALRGRDDPLREAYGVSPFRRGRRWLRHGRPSVP